jgi:hypothetical protein
MVKLILPKVNYDAPFPLIFFIGPMAGAPKWQDKGTIYIHSKRPDIYIATPRQTENSEILRFAIEGNGERFTYQLPWERQHISYGAKEGIELKLAVNMAWLPKQIEAMPINPKTGFPRPYARDTRGEIGGWGWGMSKERIKTSLVIGGEEDFDGFSVMKRNFLAVKPDMIFYNTLEQTCDAAIDLLDKKKHL